MSRLVQFGVGLTAMLASNLARGAEELPSAAQVLEKVEATAGSEEARREMRSLRMSGHLDVEGSPEITFVEKWMGKRARMDIDAGAHGTQTQGTDGTRSWSTDPALGVTVKDGPDQAAVQRFYAFQKRTPWKQIYTSARTTGREEIGGREHLRLEMMADEGDPDIWYVDADQFVVSRVEVMFPNPAGGPLPMRFDFRDWKPVEGLLFPHQRILEIGTVAMTYQYTKIELNPELREDEVAPTAEVAKAMKEGGTNPRVAGAGKCQIQTVAQQHVASVRTRARADELSKTLAMVLPEVLGHLNANGIVPTGPPFTRFHKFDGDYVELEAGIPVKDAIPSGERVKSSTLPGGKVATTWHHGSYHTLASTYDLLKQWMEGEDYEARGGQWEIYWTDPGIEPNPSNWKTQVLWPVKE